MKILVDTKTVEGIKAYPIFDMVEFDKIEQSAKESNITVTQWLANAELVVQNSMEMAFSELTFTALMETTKKQIEEWQ